MVPGFTRELVRVEEILNPKLQIWACKLVASDATSRCRKLLVSAPNSFAVFSVRDMQADKGNNLNSLKGIIQGIIQGRILSFFRGIDTRSLDYGSHAVGRCENYSKSGRENCMGSMSAWGRIWHMSHFLNS